MADENKCPKCQGEMTKGVLVDYTYAEFSKKPQVWAEDVSMGGFLAERPIKIVSYRCSNCGFLENYAKEEKEEWMNEDG